MPGKVSPITKQDDSFHLTPRKIVQELDKYIIGQEAAKRSVAIALRNRLRRLRLAPEMLDEVAPKNIILIGSTGVGKTEIARRLARLTNSPFLKVEASKFTEVGYVGRDVESMIRDLVGLAVDLVRTERRAEVRSKAGQNVEERLLSLLVPQSGGEEPEAGIEADRTEIRERLERTREKLRRQLQDGLLEDRPVEVQSQQIGFPSLRVFSNSGVEEMDINLREMLPGLGSGRKRIRRMSVAEAREYLLREEEEKLIDPEEIAREGILRVEQSGILFLDEIDKIAGRESRQGPDVSREGVQRDLLPIVEGTTVNTKFGMVRTDHILFIAAGAFHVSKPSDLIPELQGRFPIRVELDALDKNDFRRILTEPKNALIRQYQALMATEDLELEFTDESIDLIAEFAAEVNEKSENIGARRLHTILEKLLEEISFSASELSGRKQVVDADYVRKMLSDIIKDRDLSRFVL
ncbi:MAG: ATP-dependent protease ATPase subunit HslU [Acidobacteria bacterium]|nr:ATP-dependent protease ATPase subunit HslU [Acidobacteriota bacterium]